MAASSATKHPFQAEVKQLLHLMIHSLYSHREIFLRELISNASDASDKLRFAALEHPELAADAGELAIEVELDAETRTLVVRDRGIGMNHDEVVAQLGTIAHSGTARFLENLHGEQRKDSQLIGQFGVGFYSAFIVAERVEVLSRKAGDPVEAGVRWTSDGAGDFTVETVDKAAPGTEVRLTLKADADEFLDAARLSSLIRKYSDHIAFPVALRRQPGEDAETVNRAKALWTRPRADVTDEEYLEFYRHVTHDPEPPLAWTHNRVEGKREYTCLLFIPAAAPFDLWNRDSPRGLKLYVQRVFITDAASQFLPSYLRFVRGVLDASDLSLNVSRELLQDDPDVAAIKAALTKRALDLLERLAGREPEKYTRFWREFGTVLKEGLAEDPANRERIAALLRFDSTRSDDREALRSLGEYVDDMRAGQEDIYYLVGDSADAARSSPHLELFVDRGIEVLLLTDRVDEWAMQFVGTFRDKPLRDVSRGAIDPAKLGEAPAVNTEPTRDERDLLKRVKRVLRERVDEVRFSERLKSSAACLVVGEMAIGHRMQELLKAAGHEAPDEAPSLELNAGHPLIRRLLAESSEDRFERLAELVFDQATLAEGRQLADPAGFVKRLNDLLLELGGETNPPSQA